MRIVPENGTVLCEVAVPAKEETEVGGFAVRKENLPLYRIIADSTTSSDFGPGDVVLCNSTGTMLRDGQKDLYIFKAENVVGRVLD